MSEKYKIRQKACSITLEVHVVKDPETRNAGDHKVCDFRVVANPSHREQDSFFIKVETWNNNAEYVQKYITKGDNVLLLGKLVGDHYEKDGKRIEGYKITAHEVYKRTNPNKDNEDGRYHQEPAADTDEDEPKGKSMPPDGDEFDDTPGDTTKGGAPKRTADEEEEVPF